MEETFANKLAQAMKEKNYRQVDLCNKTGIDKSLMNNYLNGMCKPKHENLKLIAQALEVSEGWLIGYDNGEAIRIEANNSIIELLNCYSKLSIKQQEIILNLIKNMNE